MVLWLDGGEWDISRMFFPMVVNINLMVRYVKPTGMVNKWRFPY